MTSCKKDKFVEEIIPEETGLETNKDVLLSQLSRQDVINFFDLDFIEQTNPNLEGTPGLGEDLPAEIEAVHLDFLIKNGVTNFVPNLIPNVGYPMWRRVEIYQDDNDGSSTIVIPFANLDGDSTNAIMVAIPFEVDDFYTQQGVDRSGYYYLTTTRSELATALEDHPKINDDNVYSALLNFLIFDEDIFDYVNSHWYEIYQEYDDGFTGNGSDKGICSSSYTACVFIYAFSPGGADDKSCINTVITYTWECPGASGGFVPGGTLGSGGGISSGGGGNQGSALDALNRLVAECSTETSPDVIVTNPQHGENGGNCSALLAAIDNLGLYGLSPEMWLLLFQEGGDLLDLAATISPEDQRDFALYLNFFIPGITQQNFIAFQTNLAQVEALQEELDLDVPTFMWLLQQVISVGARENNVADEIEAFLNENPLINGVLMIQSLLPDLMTEEITSEQFTVIIELMQSIANPLSENVPRAEYINQISLIQQYLAARRTDYGEVADFLENILPRLIDVNEFSNEDVALLYSIAYDWYSECVYNTVSSVVSSVIIAFKPIIEMVLMEIAVGFAIEAAGVIIFELPASLVNSTANVWQKIAPNASSYINTLVPKSFNLTVRNGRNFYVPQSGSKHIKDLVKKDGAESYGWYLDQMPLRSQLALDDFVNAVDDIIANNPTLTWNQPYYSGKWEIIFNQPTFPGGNPVIFHALTGTF